MPGKLLSSVNSPADLKHLSIDELTVLCSELRQYIIDVICTNPGHFGASLGTVELTVALHYVFDAPNDKLVWDVGHQAYAHKILTGRRDAFRTNRLYKGLSGYPKREESEYDAFGVGHSSTSISAILGMAVAAKMNGNHSRQHIAVIGDGAMTGGMAFEALNHAGVAGANMIIILNDNGIAIDKNVGALKEYLTDIVASGAYNRFRNKLWEIMGGKSGRNSFSRNFLKKMGNAVKSSLLGRSNFFESFNFRYFGPVDGHDLKRLIKVLSHLKKISGPKILHCVTVKGKGFEPAEREQTIFHAPGYFNKETGDLIEINGHDDQPLKYQTVFGKTMMELAAANKKIIAVTPAMATGCSLDIMMDAMPERVFDVGIAEQHAVTFSAGMATEGYIPFCNIYSSFMQRGYDQMIHDVALQKLHVVFCLDRGGLVGEDGPTHHGAFDLAYMRSIPNMIVSAPMDGPELRNLLYTAQLDSTNSPFSIRYPKGRIPTMEWKSPFEKIEIGTGRRIREGKDVAILTIGHVGNYALNACIHLEKEGISAALYDMRFLKPLDEKLLDSVFLGFTRIITVEDGTVVGGLASAIQEYMAEKGLSARHIKLGIPDRFVEHGSACELHTECGYDTNGIINAVKEILNR